MYGPLFCPNECCTQEGLFDFIGPIQAPEDTPVLFGSTLYKSPQSLRVWRAPARSHYLVESSESVGRYCEASPRSGLDAATVWQSLASGNVAWVYRWYNFDNPVDSSATEYIATDLSTWTYDSYSEWDATDSAVEQNADITDPPPGDWEGIVLSKTKATTIPNNAKMTFNAIFQHRDFDTITFELESFRDDVALSAMTIQATITPDDELLLSPADAEAGTPLAAQLFVGDDGVCSVWGQFKTKGSSTFLGNAKITIRVTNRTAGGYPLDGEGTIIKHVHLHRSEYSGLDICSINVADMTRISHHLVRAERVAVVPETATRYTLAQRTVPEIIHGLVTDGSGSYSDPRRLGHWMHYGTSDSFPYNGVNYWPTWCSADGTKMGRVVVNSTGFVGIWEYNVDGTVACVKRGERGPIAFISDPPSPLIDIRWPGVRDYPNVFGNSGSSDGKTKRFHHGPMVEHTLTDTGGGTRQLLLGPTAEIYSETGTTSCGSTLWQADAIDGHTVMGINSVINNGSGNVTKARIVVDGSVVDEIAGVSCATAYKALWLHKLAGGEYRIVLTSANWNSSTDAYGGGEVCVRVLNLDGSLDWVMAFPNDGTYIDASRASYHHLYVTHGEICDGRISAASWPDFGGDPKSLHNVIAWDASWSWPMSRYKDEAGEHIEVPWYPHQPGTTGGDAWVQPRQLDVVKNNAITPYAPSEHYFDNAVCPP